MFGKSHTKEVRKKISESNKVISSQRNIKES